tara:strand:- start:74 stop:412 length:339 start_codon:yes stop_codon:yes gene_type:complete
MSAGTYNLVIDQGSDFALDLVIKQSGSALDLSNYTGRAQLRTSVDASSASASFTVTKTNASGGALKMELEASTSSSLAAGQYVYDLEIYTSGDSTVKRILQGDVTITPEVTR